MSLNMSLNMFKFFNIVFEYYKKSKVDEMPCLLVLFSDMILTNYNINDSKHKYLNFQQMLYEVDFSSKITAGTVT